MTRINAYIANDIFLEIYNLAYLAYNLFILYAFNLSLRGKHLKVLKFIKQGKNKKIYKHYLLVIFVDSSRDSFRKKKN